MSDLIKGRVWPWEKADLIARLLAEETDLTDCAADCIKELMEERDDLGRKLNTARYGQPDFAWSIHEAAMADLRAKLTKAVAGLRKIADHKHFVAHLGWTQNAEARIASATLAELEGEE